MIPNSRPSEQEDRSWKSGSLSSSSSSSFVRETRVSATTRSRKMDDAVVPSLTHSDFCCTHSICSANDMRAHRHLAPKVGTRSQEFFSKRETTHSVPRTGKDSQDPDCDLTSGHWDQRMELDGTEIGLTVALVVIIVLVIFLAACAGWRYISTRHLTLSRNTITTTGAPTSINTEFTKVSSVSSVNH